MRPFLSLPIFPHEEAELEEIELSKSSQFFVSVELEVSLASGFNVYPLLQ